LDIGKGKKIQVEFISANPTGPLTVGNGRGGFFGDVLGNVLEKSGYEVEKAYYVNDYGNQILSLGHSVLKDADAKYSGEYIDNLAKNFKDETDAYAIGKKSAKMILDNLIKKTVENLNIEYDEWFSETMLYEDGTVEKVIDLLKKNDFTYEKDNALWFKSSQFGDERDRVIIKSDGSKTYLAGDLAYHKYKFENKKFDKVINVWGSDHFGDVPGLMAGIEAMGYGKNRLDIPLLQFVTVMKDGKPVKMSKRLGTAVTMDDLLDELSVDVIRFFFLQKSANTHLNFDINLAREQSDKNPVFYIQYAYARISSILKAGEINEKKMKNIKNIDLLTHEKEILLMREILKFKDVIEDTANDYQVHRLPQYALGLAAAFHQFYNDCYCLVEDEDLREARLGLLVVTKIALNNVLNIMGVSAPDKM
jgi:arginyl-tRNA synthetase